MGVKPVVRFSDELLVEPFLASAGFVACHKEDGLALRIEGESDAPLAAICCKFEPLSVSA